MAIATSPLRYPGGKTCLLELVANILRLNKLERGHYAEPYAGGCGLALALLYEGHVSDIHVNDVDPSIWSFWHSVLDHTDDLVRKIQNTEITVEEWHKQREIHLKQDVGDPLALGFSTFFLNRTNRSGIIKGAGVIGGLSQTGNYKIDCRFNRDDLEKRIRRVSKYKGQIHLHRMDATDFLSATQATLPESTFYCIDPPYYNKGSILYTSFYRSSDHCKLSEVVTSMDRPWIVTYDNTEEIQKLYKSRRQFTFDIGYSVQTKRIGTELMIASKGLKMPTELRDRQVSRPQYRAA